MGGTEDDAVQTEAVQTLSQSIGIGDVGSGNGGEGLGGTTALVDGLTLEPDGAGVDQAGLGGGHVGGGQDELQAGLVPVHVTGVALAGDNGDGALSQGQLVGEVDGQLLADGDDGIGVALLDLGIPGPDALVGAALQGGGGAVQRAGAAGVGGLPEVAPALALVHQSDLTHGQTIAGGDGEAGVAGLVVGDMHGALDHIGADGGGTVQHDQLHFLTVELLGLDTGSHQVSQIVQVGPGLGTDLLQVEEDDVDGLVPCAVVAGDHGAGGTVGAGGVLHALGQGSDAQGLGVNGAAGVQGPVDQTGGGIDAVGNCCASLGCAAQAVLAAEQTHQVDVLGGGQLVGQMVHLGIDTDLVGEQSDVLTGQVLLPVFAFEQDLSTDLNGGGTLGLGFGGLGGEGQSGAHADDHDQSQNESQKTHCGGFFHVCLHTFLPCTAPDRRSLMQCIALRLRVDLRGAKPPFA